MAKKRSTKAKKKSTTKRQRMTPNQAAFAKQQQRIKRFIKSAEKRGYSFPANAVPERPARVTKRDISRITAIKPETLYQQATFVYDGSTFTGTEGRMIERSLAAQKGALHKREKDKLLGAVKKEGVTLVPLGIYFNKRGIAKVELGLAKGKQAADKRAAIKEREWKRDQARILRERNR